MTSRILCRGATRAPAVYVHARGNATFLSVVHREFSSHAIALDNETTPVERSIIDLFRCVSPPPFLALSLSLSNQANSEIIAFKIAFEGFRYCRQQRENVTSNFSQFLRRTTRPAVGGGRGGERGLEASPLNNTVTENRATVL